MKLDLTGGRDAATYSGTLNVSEFDLGTWTGDKQVGKTDFSVSIKEGSKGLRLETLDATIDGTLQALQYKGYTYKNAKISGRFAQKIFDGIIKVDEKEISLDFNGLVNIKEQQPIYDFKLNIKKLDLFTLGFTKKPLTVSGKFDHISLVGNNLRNLHGDMLVSQINYEFNNEPRQFIDSIYLQKQLKSDGSSFLRLESSVLSAMFVGNFDIASLPNTSLYVFEKNFPALAGKFGHHSFRLNLSQ